MATYVDRGIVLRRIEHGEADRILTVLTRGHGKVGVIARGARRLHSRYGGLIELFAELDLELARGRNLDVLVQAAVVPGPVLAGDLDRTAYAGLVAEVADAVTEDRHPLEGLYDLTRAALVGLGVEDDPRLAVIEFLARILDFMGWGLQVDVCVQCGRPLRPEPAAFQAHSGGFLCSSCVLGEPEVIGVTALKVLRILFAGDPALFRRLRLDAATLADLERVLEIHLEWQLERRLRSLHFLRQVRGGG